MAGRLSITATDLRRLRALTDPGQLDQSDQRLPRPLLQGLADLIGCDNVSYESHDLEAQAVTNHVRLISLDRTVNFANDDVQKSFWGLYHQGLCDYWPRTGDYSSARRMLLEPHWQDWGRSAYPEWVRSMGVRGEITVALPPENGLEERLILWRYSGHEFSARDGLLLSLIHPHLVVLQRITARRRAVPPDLTPRQWELIRLMSAGMTNHQIATRLAISEGTVRTHCENIFRQLHVNNRVAAIAKALPTNR